jgi:hypothetical protein
MPFSLFFHMTFARPPSYLAWQPVWKLQRWYPVNKSPLGRCHAKRHARIKFGECDGIFASHFCGSMVPFWWCELCSKFLQPTPISISRDECLAILEFIEPRISSLFHQPMLPPPRYQNSTLDQAIFCYRLLSARIPGQMSSS